MKRIFLICTATFYLLTLAQAQSIVGKWKCPKKYFDCIGLVYYGMRGYYKFNKDSTFILRINGGSGQNIYIKVTGKYKIENNNRGHPGWNLLLY